jgi:type IX secretion system PorP/SprF family membrane protein
MNQKMYLTKKCLTAIIFIFIALSLRGQQSTLLPVSTWIFNPVSYNPAISGSKDYFSVDFISSTRNNINAQIIGGNARLTKKEPEYPGSTKYTKYTNFGIGGNLVNQTSDLNGTILFGLSGSYHLKMNENSLSFLSIGLSLNGIFNTLDSITQVDPEITETINQSFEPNVDFGIYYYSPAFYVGLSSTNILESGGQADSLEVVISESRRYYFITGYKFLILRNPDLVIEPSVIISAADTTFKDILNNIHPKLTIYVENFCFGSYLYDWDKLSLFFQYNYPGFYLGGFVGIPLDSPYFISEPTIEFSTGINLSYRKSRPYKRYHW